MKKIIVIAILSLLLFACSENSDKVSQSSDKISAVDEPNTEKIPTPGGEPPPYDPIRGTGKFSHVDIGNNLDVTMATGGEKIYTARCSGCHKLTDERLVGPGWKGVTTRYKPEWIMNFVTNTDEMLNKDPKAQAQLEICLVRMPNQNLEDVDARQLLEFMRKNDGAK
ncbi:MAG: cytochrome c [Chitinophagaceae bacterium]|nr:cytochrome c [Chitinophagaceae bacterium]